ncbi:MAG: radical SAM protein [Candidatus Nomurabacteria bacterium]|jgi:radical SAM protein with 4Fe4S-binding SPASM domain|nr:radical SAM protein [Candidatus Nomurabacteria bacterium]
MTKKFNVGWGLTNKCNMRCQFCYSEDARHELQECNISDWKNFADRNHAFIDSINYGTGENAILDDFFYFAKYMKQKYPEIRQSLTTNGYISERTKTNPQFKDIFQDCIDEVDVSVDFYNKEKHSEFRGQPNAYDWAMNTLHIAKEMGKLATIVFVGFNETCDEHNLVGLFELARQNDAFLRMNIYRPVKESKIISDRFILSYDKLKQTLQYVNNEQEIVSLSDMLLGNVFTGDTSIEDNTGKDSIRILPDGTICPSTYLIAEKYRKNISIHNADLSTLKFDQFNDIEIPKDCAGCKYEKSCRGGVYDRRILWYDTFSERDPYCPMQNGDALPEQLFRIRNHIGRVSVHDGYLPTLFFKPKD